jgi:hypothetical protein
MCQAASWTGRTGLGFRKRQVTFDRAPGQNTCRIADLSSDTPIPGSEAPLLSHCSQTHRTYKAELGLLSSYPKKHTQRLQTPHCKHPAFEHEEHEEHHPTRRRAFAQTNLNPCLRLLAITQYIVIRLDWF